MSEDEDQKYPHAGRTRPSAESTQQERFICFFITLLLLQSRRGSSVRSVRRACRHPK